MQVSRTGHPLALYAAAAGAIALIVLIVPSNASSAQKGSVEGAVTINQGGKSLNNRSGIVVSLENVPDSRPERGAVEIRQKNKQFDPPLTVVPKGSTIAFPNQDKIFHNVFSVSKAARFDLGLYKSGESKSVKMRRSGVVDVYCNIHPKMVAKVKVVDTRFYAVTGNDGKFRIDDVPPGSYPVVAWQPYGKEFRGTVKVTAGGTAKLSIDMNRDGKKPKRHLRKDGTPYGRYK
jgi:plastocyanin